MALRNASHDELGKEYINPAKIDLLFSKTCWFSVCIMPDYLKKGGEYEEYTSFVRQIDPIERMVVFLAGNGRSAGKMILVDDIKEIHGELVNYMDEV